MEIVITKGSGHGSTFISAFDAALQDAGVSNYNLIRLSSVIPPHAKITQKKYITRDEEFGQRLYMVMAEMRSDVVGEWVGSGIGWYQLSTGAGLFVEHEFTGTTKEELEKRLRDTITNSLRDMCGFRGYEFSESMIAMELATMQVKDRQVACALILAVYKAEPW